MKRKYLVFEEKYKKLNDLVVNELNYKWALAQENLTLLYVNNKGAKQPVHPLSLISTFVVHSLQSLIAKPAMSKVLIFLLVSVADQTSLTDLVGRKPRSQVFSRQGPNCFINK